MDDWIVPRQLFQALDSEFHFNDDPCVTIVGRQICLQSDGLQREWGSRTFVNPPYSNPRPWIAKAIDESRSGKIVVMLLKSDTSAAWFHELVLPHGEIRWIKGRLCFTDLEGNSGRAPFASMIVVFRKEHE